MLKKILWFLSSQLGINPILFIKSLRGSVSYLIDLYNFNKNYSGNLKITPCLADRYDEGGSVRSEYFWQDLLVARFIFERNPVKHVDVGSRVDGFVAHVASFREVEVFDVRQITSIIPGIKFIQADLMDDLVFNKKNDYTDSLSCLHALEHFGLGRYGDPIDPIGYQKGLINMSRILKKDGIFYLSIPLGQERVEFNANHIFNPSKILDFCYNINLSVIDLTIIKNDGIITKIKIDNESLSKLSMEDYSLGIFTFIKI